MEKNKKFGWPWCNFFCPGDDMGMLSPGMLSPIKKKKNYFLETKKLVFCK